MLSYRVILDVPLPLVLVLPEVRPYLKDLPVLADSATKGPARACTSP